MQTHMIKAKTAGNLELTPIIFNIPARITRKRENAAVHIAAQENGFAIEEDIFAFGGNLAQTKALFQRIHDLITLPKHKRSIVEIRIIIPPQPRLITHWHRDTDFGALNRGLP